MACSTWRPGANRVAPRRDLRQASRFVRRSALACPACRRTRARWPTLASAAAAATAICGLGVGPRCALAPCIVAPVAARACSILVLALVVHGDFLLVASIRDSTGQTLGSRTHYRESHNPRADPARAPRSGKLANYPRGMRTLPWAAKSSSCSMRSRQEGSSGCWWVSSRKRARA